MHGRICIMAAMGSCKLPSYLSPPAKLKAADASSDLAATEFMHGHADMLPNACTGTFRRSRLRAG